MEFRKSHLAFLFTALFFILLFFAFFSDFSYRYNTREEWLRCYRALEEDHFYFQYQDRSSYCYQGPVLIYVMYFIDTLHLHALIEILLHIAIVMLIFKIALRNMQVQRPFFILSIILALYLIFIRPFINVEYYDISTLLASFFFLWGFHYYDSGHKRSISFTPILFMLSYLTKGLALLPIILVCCDYLWKVMRKKRPLPGFLLFLGVMVSLYLLFRILFSEFFRVMHLVHYPLISLKEVFITYIPYYLLPEKLSFVYYVALVGISFLLLLYFRDTLSFVTFFSILGFLFYFPYFYNIATEYRFFHIIIPLFILSLLQFYRKHWIYIALVLLVIFVPLGYFTFSNYAGYYRYHTFHNQIMDFHEVLRDQEILSFDTIPVADEVLPLVNYWNYDPHFFNKLVHTGYTSFRSYREENIAFLRHYFRTQLPRFDIVSFLAQDFPEEAMSIFLQYAEENNFTCSMLVLDMKHAKRGAAHLRFFIFQDEDSCVSYQALADAFHTQLSYPLSASGLFPSYDACYLQPLKRDLQFSLEFSNIE